VRRRLLGILILVILGFNAATSAATASTAHESTGHASTGHASTGHAARAEPAAHVPGAQIAATPQFLAALKRAREAGVGVPSDIVTGICWSGNSLCWRDMPSGAIDMWNRDISGDPRQQWDVVYEGTVDQTGCGSVGGNFGVYAFFGYNGSYASAGYSTNGGNSYYVGDGSSYDYWAWDTNGALLNCADTRNNANGPYSIVSPPWSEGTQLTTAPEEVYSYTPFQQISVTT
jgi:hypothetical protein